MISSPLIWIFVKSADPSLYISTVQLHISPTTGSPWYQFGSSPGWGKGGSSRSDGTSAVFVTDNEVTVSPMLVTFGSNNDSPSVFPSLSSPLSLKSCSLAVCPCESATAFT